MKNFIRVMAGFLIAILAVLIVIGLYNKGIAGKLGKNVEENKSTVSNTTAFEKAVLANPILEYTGKSSKEAEKEYCIFEEINLKEDKGKSEKTLAQAVSDGEIKHPEVEVLLSDGSKLSEASVDSEKGIVKFPKSGFYQIKVSGKDEDNNQTEISFYVAVNRKGA